MILNIGNAHNDFLADQHDGETLNAKVAAVYWALVEFTFLLHGYHMGTVNSSSWSELAQESYNYHQCDVPTMEVVGIAY